MSEIKDQKHLPHSFSSDLEIMNYLGKKSIPFLFILDFTLKAPVIIPLQSLGETGILYDMEGKRNFQKKAFSIRNNLNFVKYPVTYETYRKAFTIIRNHLVRGDSYLVNLTFPTRVETSFSLPEIFHCARARFKLLVPGRFVVFSPELFVRIKDNRIYSYPMKGTADATIAGHAEELLSGYKEQAEHHTIVDLIRNDLGQVADDIKVERFAYREVITTHEKKLMQVSSEISGRLQTDWPGRLGDIFKTLLPAGSVTGAPKPKTLEIIREAEIYERGYYTGVFGVFDGSILVSAVMIRFIEQTVGGFIYKSGGGITAYSDPRQEYMEMIDKVYVPVA